MIGMKGCVCCCLLLAVVAPARGDELEQVFARPPDAKKVQVWWHWMNNNVTREGITADLEAMKAEGIGGAQIFQVGSGIPAGPVTFLSEEWFGLMRFAAQEAQRLGLELGTHNCPGWSSSGGPWNKQERGMRTLTFSETRVKGPARVDQALPRPRTVWDIYEDVALVAVKLPAQGAKRAERYAALAGLDKEPANAAPAAEALTPGAVLRSECVTLTGKLSPAGRLVWDAPEGEWLLLRMGTTPCGKNNHPSPEGGSGPECDKLSKEALDAHWSGYLGRLLERLGPLAGTTFRNVLIDSYEVGPQAWTAGFDAAFKARCGYDPGPFYPVLAGYVVDSATVSERFLWDYRTVANALFVENYFNHFRDLCHKAGLVYAVEPYGNGNFDELMAADDGDLVLSEFWMGGAPNGGRIKMIAGSAHTTGPKFIAAESFTASPENGRWLEDGFALKRMGDAMFTAGLNHIVIHSYAHQPWTNRVPGMTMGQWGIHFNRNTTWWEEGKSWIAYLNRCQALLTEGDFVADVCRFNGEPSTTRFRSFAAPTGYDCDIVSETSFLKRVSVKDGRITFPNGMSYAYLSFPPDAAFKPGALRRAKELVEAGATVVAAGAKPSCSPSLVSYPADDAVVRRLADELWGAEGKGSSLGKGRFIAGQELDAVFLSDGLKPDFACDGAGFGYIHRRAGDADIYFVNNPALSTVSAECLFRVTGKVPEFWNAVDASIKPVPVYQDEAGQTRLPLRLDAAGSIFVVFRPGESKRHAVRLTFSPSEGAQKVSDGREKLAVLQARYGVLDKPGKNKDVAEAIRACVATNGMRFKVCNALFGDDPAKNERKQLRVSYTFEGVPGEIVVAENTPLTLPAPRLQILAATYGKLGSDKVLDASRGLAAHVEDGCQIRVWVSSRLVGKTDPAPGKPKALWVKYRFNGLEVEKTVPQNALFQVPETGYRVVEELPACENPAYEVELEKRGPLLLAWQPGTFEITLSDGRAVKKQVYEVPAPFAVEGPWQVLFQPGRGAPERATFDKLASWTQRGEDGIRYFSGSAVYETALRVPDDLLGPGRRMMLDLGAVRNFATVTLNGQELGGLWKPPFVVDVTQQLKVGDNALRIKVTNRWVNRLIGDDRLPPEGEWAGQQLKAMPEWAYGAAPSASGRVTFTTYRHWFGGDEPPSSGLLGPVCIRTVFELPGR